MIDNPCPSCRLQAKIDNANRDPAFCGTVDELAAHLRCFLTFKCRKEPNHRDELWWVAQCIEFELATQAPTLDELLVEVRRIVHAHVQACAAEGIEPWTLETPASVVADFTKASVTISVEVQP